MNSSLRIIFSLALPLAGATGFLACGSEGGDDDVDQMEGMAEPGVTDGLVLVYSPMYSAFEPDHAYRVPVVVEGLPKDLTWTADPSDAVQIDAFADQGAALITVKKAGKVTIKAVSAGMKKSGTATLDVAQATPELWALGQKRYTSMNPAFVATDAGRIPLGINPNASCNNCHGEGSSLNVQHTPQQTAGYSADELIKVFTEAKKPEGAPQRVTNIPAQLWQQIHKWNMTDEEKQGIVVYLRSLEPKPTNTAVDFAGIRTLLPEGGINLIPRGPRRDGGAGSDAGGGSGDAGTGTVVTPTGMDAGT